MNICKLYPASFVVENKSTQKLVLNKSLYIHIILVVLFFITEHRANASDSLHCNSSVEELTVIKSAILTHLNSSEIAFRNFQTNKLNVTKVEYMSTFETAWQKFLQLRPYCLTIHRKIFNNSFYERFIEVAREQRRAWKAWELLEKQEKHLGRRLHPHPIECDCGHCPGPRDIIVYLKRVRR